MEALLWVLLTGFAAVASAILAWFVMQSRMEVALAAQRESLSEARVSLETEMAAVRASFQSAIRAAEETARRQAFDSFLGEINVQQRTSRIGLPACPSAAGAPRPDQKRARLILQERMFFRNLPLSDWIEHEIVLQEGMDVDRLVQEMTVFDSSVVNIADGRRPRRALA